MDPLMVIVVLALVATIITLFMGLAAMGRGEAVDQKFSTPLMWARVGLQAFTILLLFLALYLR
jgi:hypothetical protein